TFSSDKKLAPAGSHCKRNSFGSAFGEAGLFRMLLISRRSLLRRERLRGYKHSIMFPLVVEYFLER
ncbi:hypothetical protein, partial [Enterobacter hormaechei]|uniref:hypothetical protein n=1 Tax=Enterobacter hormaechei TaxID=158836 RepID=UPI00197A9C72